MDNNDDQKPSQRIRSSVKHDNRKSWHGSGSSLPSTPPPPLVRPIGGGAHVLPSKTAPPTTQTLKPPTQMAAAVKEATAKPPIGMTSAASARVGAPPIGLVKPLQSLEIREEEDGGIHSSPHTNRYRGLNRTATLKYSGGALHDLKAAPSFDHTYDSAAVKATPPPPIITAVSAKAGTEGGGCVVLPALQSSPLNGPTCSKDSSPGTAGKTAGSTPGSTGKMAGSSLSTVTGSSSSPGSASSSPCLTRSTNVTPTRGLSPRPCLPEQENYADVTVRHLSRGSNARKLARHSSIHDEDDLERSQSEGLLRGNKRLPPLVRIHTEPQDRASLRIPRTRASYSLSRTDKRDNIDEDTSDNGSDRSASPFSADGLQVNSSGSVFKSASMCNMSSSSASDTGQNSMAVSEARKRSYLVGSVGPTSLLGTQELEKQFPDRIIRIFVGTWNMNGQVPPRHLSEFLLPANLQYVPDLLVVGTQEVFPEKTEWEIRLQDTLGPSHVLFHSASLGTLHLSIFLRRDLIWYCSIPEDDSFSTRPGAQFKTKGAVAVGLIIFGTSFLFVNSHLTAHQDNVKDRVRDLKKIYAMLNLPKALPLKRRRDMFDSFDVVFWCGDLNFRLEQTREVIIRDIEDGLSVLESDQLTWLMSEGTVFRGFREHPIQFRPTYKYDPGTDNFDTSTKQRIPSYTDRVLYKHHPGTKVTPLHYHSVQGVITSDHKPVWGMFEVGIRPGKDSVPLAGGLFNRQVYLEGLKRRSESLKPIIGKSANVNMCSIS